MNSRKLVTKRGLKELKVDSTQKIIEINQVFRKF